MINQKFVIQDLNRRGRVSFGLNDIRNRIDKISKLQKQISENAYRIKNLLNENIKEYEADGNTVAAGNHKKALFRIERIIKDIEDFAR